MAPIFRKIVCFHCAEPQDGSLQMAIDELLLGQACGVVFRDYRWLGASTSIGYFGASSEFLAQADPAGRLVRRPSGGGLVEHGHGQDYTYSVVISASIARQMQLTPRESYRAIHGVLAKVLRDFGIAACLASGGEPGAGGQACFANPVGDDLMLDGRKIAGAGQKRSRGAILHQGSVQPVDLPTGFGATFAAALAEEVEIAGLDTALLARAEALAEEKYRSDAWIRRR